MTRPRCIGRQADRPCHPCSSSGLVKLRLEHSISTSQLWRSRRSPSYLSRRRDLRPPCGGQRRDSSAVLPAWATHGRLSCLLANSIHQSTPPNHHVKRRRQKKATRSTRDHETGTKKGRRPRGRRPAQRKGCLLISLRHGLGHVAVGALHIFHSVRRGVGFTAATRAACGGRWGKPELPPVRR